MDDSNKNITTQIFKRDKTNIYESHVDISDCSHLLEELSMKPRDRYQFIRTIGIGGMKTVLLVYDKDTRRNVALAMMPDYNSRSDSELAKFINEALITAKLEHPHIIPIHDIGLDSNMSPYFVMTYLSGMMLSSLLSRMRNGDEEITKFYYARKMLLNFQKICHAVEFAHSQNILHLDLKPANIHIGKHGEVHVLDWGLAEFVPDLHVCKDKDISAKVVENRNRKSVTSGTLGYMAPEQALGNTLDCRTDVYSLGAILFAILTFKSPNAFVKDNSMEALIQATVSGAIINDVVLENSIRPIPQELDAICRKAMATSPAGRYQSVKDLRDDIGNYLKNYPTVAEKPAASKKVVLMIKRNMVMSVVLGAVIFIILLLLLFLFFITSEKIILNF